MDAGTRHRVFGRRVYPYPSGNRHRRRLDPSDSGTPSSIASRAQVAQQRHDLFPNQIVDPEFARPDSTPQPMSALSCTE